MHFPMRHWNPVLWDLNPVLCTCTHPVCVFPYPNIETHAVFPLPPLLQRGQCQYGHTESCIQKALTSSSFSDLLYQLKPSQSNHQCSHHSKTAAGRPSLELVPWQPQLPGFRTKIGLINQIPDWSWFLLLVRLPQILKMDSCMITTTRAIQDLNK